LQTFSKDFFYKITQDINTQGKSPLSPARAKQENPRRNDKKLSVLCNRCIQLIFYFSNIIFSLFHF